MQMNYNEENLYLTNVDYASDDYSSDHTQHDYYTDPHHDHSKHNENHGNETDFGHDLDHDYYTEHNISHEHDSGHHHTEIDFSYHSEDSNYVEINDGENFVNEQRSGSEQNPFSKPTSSYHVGEMIVFEKGSETSTGKILSMNWEGSHYAFKVEKKGTGEVFTIYGADILGAE